MFENRLQRPTYDDLEDMTAGEDMLREYRAHLNSSAQATTIRRTMDSRVNDLYFDFPVKKCVQYQKLPNLPPYETWRTAVLARLHKEYDHLQRRNFHPSARSATKEQLHTSLEQWVGEQFRTVQQLRIGGSVLSPGALDRGLYLDGNSHPHHYEYPGQGHQIDHDIATYMRHAAYRAPEVPPGVKRPTYLYRHHGRAGRKPGYNGGYITTSLDNVGDIRIAIDDIPRGTPWVWYKGGQNKEFFPAKWNPYLESDEYSGEVLLPPGALYLKPGSTRDAVYVPDPAAASILDPKTKMIQKIKTDSKKRKRGFF
jgi:hypothetical protein